MNNISKEVIKEINRLDKWNTDEELQDFFKELDDILENAKKDNLYIK